MKFLMGIAYVNRPDLLHLAVKSIEPYWPNTMIIDNSPNRDLLTDSFLLSKVQIIPAPISLTFTQTMNFLQKKGEELACDCIMFMHNDAEAAPNTAEAFKSFIEALYSSQQRWGVVFSHYDIFVAFNMDAVRAVGPWDTTLPQYFADNDYYRRLRLAGYPSVESNLEVLHHNSSSTLQNDAYRKYINGITFPLYKRYYEMKWGGNPGEEKYATPFNQ